MITYKGTDKDMKCYGGFQYEIGKEYKDGGAIRCGSKGFHSCKAPLDVFSYFHPKDGSRFFVCEASGDVDEGTDDSKIASSKLSLKTELTIPALVKAQIEYVKSKTTTEHTNQKMSTAGDRGAATAGDGGAATAGYMGAATSRGTVSVGENGVGLVRGNNVKIRGGLGAILTIAEESDGDYEIKDWKSAVVDGEIIKPYVWYRLIDGEFCEENNE